MGRRNLISSIIAASGLSIALIALAGCAEQVTNPPVAGEVPTVFRPALQTEPPVEPREWAVRLRMFSIEVPVGMSSRSELIWSHLDEEPIQAGRTGVLAANGFRVGTAGRQAWPQLANILSEMTGQQLNELILTFPPGKVIPVTLKQDQPSRTIFIYYQDRTADGQDYPPGDNLLAIAVTINHDDPSKVVLTATPQIRLTEPEVTIVKSPYGAYSKKTEQPIISFRSLTFQITLPSQDIIVIGPGAESSRTTSVAYNFLVSGKQGIEFERILVLVPETWALTEQEAPAAAGAANGD